LSLPDEPKTYTSAMFAPIPTTNPATALSPESISISNMVPESAGLAFMDDALEDEVEELEGKELMISWEELEQHKLRVLTAYQKITQSKTWTEWKTAEANRCLGYNGQAKHTKQLHAQKARQREEKDKERRASYVVQLSCLA
jgi:hypothetical protein